jgi:hypothetical protein
MGRGAGVRLPICEGSLRQMECVGYGGIRASGVKLFLAEVWTGPPVSRCGSRYVHTSFATGKLTRLQSDHGPVWLSTGPIDRIIAGPHTKRLSTFC